MKVTKFKMKYQGVACVFFRVIDQSGQVLQVFDTENEAVEWMAAK